MAVDDVRDDVKESRKTNLTIILAAVALVLVFGVFTVLLWRAHFFSYTGSESSAKTVAEALTLVGGMIGGVISVLGLVLKYSLDRQTEARLAADSERSDNSQRESEKRLKLEAATKVIELFATKDGHDAPELQIAGGVLTLSSLGQHSLALVLTSDLLRRGKLDASTVCVVLDQALRENSESIQIHAISLLDDNAAKMLTEDGFECPLCILNWENCLTAYARQWAMVVLVKILLARPKSEWFPKYEFNAYAIASALALAWLKTDEDGRLKADAAAILNRLLPALPTQTLLFHPRRTIDLTQIRNSVADAKDAGSSSAGIIVANLEKWIEGDDATVAQRGVVPASPS